MAAITATHARTASTASSDGDSDADFHDAVSGLAAADAAPASGGDIDAPPAFPALNSAQRSGGSSSSSGSGAHAGPSRAPAASAAGSAGPSFSVSGPASGASRGALKASSSPAAPAARSSLRAVLGVPPSSSSGASSLLAAPPRTSALTAPPGVGGAGGARIGGAGGAGGLGVPKSGGLGVPTETGGGARKKVSLAPGCSPLDWAREKASGKPELRAGLTSLQRITPSELAKHNTRDDAWSAFNGKVYNLTPYLRFHPGGEKEALRVAGRDGTRLFMLTHSWVNIDAMIDTTMVGMLVPEP